MATVRKVQSKVVSKSKEQRQESSDQKETIAPERAEQSVTGLVKGTLKTRKCAFCTNKTEPLYWDAAALRRFISDRGRIVPRSRSGACAKHQRRVSKQIKYARHLSLLPFTVRA